MDRGSIPLTSTIKELTYNIYMPNYFEEREERLLKNPLENLYEASGESFPTQNIGPTKFQGDIENIINDIKPELVEKIVE